MFVQTKWYVARGIKLDFKRLENLHLTNNTKPQSRKGPQTQSGSSLGRRKQPLDPHPYNDTKERKIALYFNCLQCV